KIDVRRSRVGVCPAHSLRACRKKIEANTMLAPDLGRALGSARTSFSFLPPNEGDGAPKRRMPRITHGAARLTVGRARSSRPVRSGRDGRRCGAHHRALVGFPPSRGLGPAGALVRKGRLAESRPGTWLRATPAGAASRPALMTPHESAPRRTRRQNEPCTSRL